MNNKLSVLVITKNASKFLFRSLTSVKNIADEIIIVDEYSTDQTVNIGLIFTNKIYHHSTQNQGKQKNYALSKAKNKWVLILDSDEVITEKLSNEIKNIINRPKTKNGYYIPYINHFLNRPVIHGGENYSKLILFQKKYGVIINEPVHDKVIVKKNDFGYLKHHIKHYSYQSLSQILIKFNEYAKREAAFKHSLGEKSSPKKVFLYPLHMFYSRYFKDCGYKDGVVLRIFLDGLHAYLEFMTYYYLLIRND